MVDAHSAGTKSELMKFGTLSFAQTTYPGFLNICTFQGGSPESVCAAGFGTCCVSLVKICGQMVTANKTYIQNPGYSGTYNVPGTCQYEVVKTSEGT